MDHLRGRERQRVTHACAWQVLVHAWAAVRCNDDDRAEQEHAQALQHLETIDRIGGDQALLSIACAWTDLLRYVRPGALPDSGPQDAMVQTCLVDEDGTQLAPEALGPALGLSTVMLGALLTRDIDQGKALVGAARASGVATAMIANVAYALCSLAAQLSVPATWATSMNGFSLACPGCTAPLGGQHRAECTQGWCRGTGRLLTMCSRVEHLAECEPVVWDGYPHGTIECVEGDLHRTWKPGRGWVACSSSDPDARIDVPLLWQSGRWDAQEQVWVLP